ncbi:hypothetical protein F2Q69_00025190 [Brassica cretica]|uniref:COBRA-like protein n=1 Tax=Brassica cretica TaxID=69181 RepID=A0A8S9QD82_BRACR|nr:hypothetical protein F2Q69_00025190 [Brassica cretica]
MKWDVMSWTPDGYVAVVTMFNFQKYRHIPSPGWTLGWKWAKKEVIWSMVGAQTTEQGDCSKYKGTLHAHTNSFLLRELQLAAFLCLLSTMRPLLDVQLALADAKTTKQGLVPVLSEHTALSLCCVSPPTKKGTVLPPLVQCTRHLCPIRVHWHVKQNYKEYWRMKITITNFNYRLNYSQWNMVAQHPNLDNITQIFSFNYKSLTPYAGLNDTAMLWGVKFYNDFLSEAGPLGNVQSEILFRKDQATFTFEKATVLSLLRRAPPSSCLILLLHIRRIGLEKFPRRLWSETKPVPVESCRLGFTAHVLGTFPRRTRAVPVPPPNPVIVQSTKEHYMHILTVPCSENSSLLHDTAMLWGVKFYNDFLSEAGPLGNVQSEILFRKDQATFTFEKGWAFPRRIYFNGDNCVMPPPDTYPFLPNGGFRQQFSVFSAVLLLVLVLFFFST